MLRELYEIIGKLNYILDKKQKINMIVVFCLTLIRSLFELVSISIILPFIQVMVSQDTNIDNRLIGFLYSCLDQNNNPLVASAIGIACIFFIKNIYILISAFFQYDYSSKVQMNLSNKMLNSYFDHSYLFFTNINSADIIRGCINDITGVYNIINSLLDLSAEFLNVILISFFLLKTDGFIAGGLILIVFFVLVIMIMGFKPFMKKLGINLREAVFEQNKAMLESIAGVKEIFVMQRQRIFCEYYRNASNKYRKISRINGTLNSSPDRIVELICVIGIVFILVLKTAKMGSEDIIYYIPTLAVFAMSAFKIFPSIGKISNRINNIVYCYPSLNNVFLNFQEACELSEKKIHSGIPSYKANVVSEKELIFKENILISDVTWKYGDNNKYVLNNVSINIKKGQSIGIIGTSGAGKSTLVDIILGLIEPCTGGVFLDGNCILNSKKQWAKLIGYVPQNIFLLDDTIENNIRFGVKNKNDELDMRRALQQAQLDTFVSELKDGLDTIIGEKGIKLSGGQRQRIAIARALYNNPQILILDEATSALDNQTEEAVMDAISALQGQVTMIIVAHRLSTVMECDLIYEIKDGVVQKKRKEDLF